jgi:5'-3' exonuclease
MGIPSYFSYIVKNHPEILRKFCKELNVNNLYLDCNSIVYDIYHKLEFDKLTDEISLAIIKKVCSKIEYYIELICPNSRIIIAFDGVAPVAKLDQQRSRRYKSSYQNEILREIHKKNEPDPWNTAAITPGTKFMKNLSDYVRTHFDNPKFYNVSLIINSTSEIFGEGEHKIFEYIRENAQHNDTTVIYGLDADLIMLSINHLPICNNIYLFRETPHFIQSIDSSLEPNENYILDIPLLAENIMTFMNNDVKSSKEMQYNRIYDYIFLSFFLGNDFLPHFPALNIRTGGINKLLDVYKTTIGKTNQVLTDGKKIYWNNLRKLIQVLSNQEELYIKEEYKLRNKREKYNYPTTKPEEIFKKFEAIPTYERELEKYIDPFKDGWESRYYHSLFNIEEDEKNKLKNEICINYLEGIEWTLKYYTTGCPDWRWHYKYHYPPLLCDLIKCIPVFDTSFIENKLPNPVSQIVQLCYVLPRQSLSLLPENICKKLIKEHECWYKTDCSFIWCFCRYFWESHVQMNEINIEELEAFIENNFKK